MGNMFRMAGHNRNMPQMNVMNNNMMMQFMQMMQAMMNPQMMNQMQQMMMMGMGGGRNFFNRRGFNPNRARGRGRGYQNGYRCNGNYRNNQHL